MSGRHFHFAGAEGLDQQIGALGRHVEKVLLAGRFVVGCSRFVHVAQVVQLMADSTLRATSAFIGSAAGLLGRCRSCRARSTQCRDSRRPPERRPCSRRFRRHTPRALESGCVISEYEAPSMIFERSLSLKPNMPTHWLVRLAGRDLEILDPPRLFAGLETIWNRHRPIHFQSRPPEAVAELHMVRRPPAESDSRPLPPQSQPSPH